MKFRWLSFYIFLPLLFIFPNILERPKEINEVVIFQKFNEQINAYEAEKDIVIDSILPETFKKQNDLDNFSKVKWITMTLNIEYEKDGEIKQYRIISRFHPEIDKSFAFWDTIMSV